MTLSARMSSALAYIRERQPPVAYVAAGTARALARRGLIESYLVAGVWCWRVTEAVTT